MFRPSVTDHNRAVSLLETLIALFTLLSAFVIILSLFLRSTSYLVNVERKVLGVAFAETVMDDVRVWASDYHNYSGDWSSWSSVTDPAYPSFEARLGQRAPQVLNPCSFLEADKPAAQRLVMTDSFRDVTLLVLHNGAEQLSLSTRLAEPVRRVKEVRVTPLAGTSLAANSNAGFQATLLDVGNDPIADASFRWSVQSNGGNGTARSQEPDTSRGLLTNSYLRADGSPHIVAGLCRVKAVARYRGKEYSGLSVPVTLLP